MPDWYVYEEGTETGPIGHDAAIRLLQSKDPDRAYVWRDGFEDWTLLRDVPELAAAVGQQSVTTTTAFIGKPAASAAGGTADPGSVNGVCKLAWAQAGALIGLAICGADLLLEWRGSRFEAWDSIAGFEDNIGSVVGNVVLASFLGFIAGAIRDAVDGFAPRQNVSPRKARKATRPRFTNVMARHWRGELPLWISCWVFGVIGGIVISFMPAAAVAVFNADRSYSPSSIFSASAAVWVAIFILALWLTVGVWRSATRHATAHRAGHASAEGAGLAPFWGGIAKLGVVLSFVPLLLTFGTEWLPQLGELYKIAFYDDPDIPPYSIRIVRNGTEAEIVGGFKFGLTDDFAAVTKAAPHVKFVRLDSVGGRLGEGVKLFRLIRERGLDTYVSSKCLSACTLAFAGGHERLLKRGAALGFHKGSFPGTSESEFDGLQHRVFAAAGFDSRFIEKALSTPHKDLWKPPPDILLAARVITGITDGIASAASGLGDDSDLATTTPAFRVIQPR